jgi:hypothetical protein
LIAKIENREKLDQILSDVIFEMRTCENNNSEEGYKSKFREKFRVIFKKPEDQRIIKGLKIDYPRYSNKATEIIKSFGLILGTMSRNLSDDEI